MRLNTASVTVGFAKKLEDDSARFYEGLAAQNPANSVVLLSLAKENRRCATDIERAYYGVITDAIESCFTFDIDTEKYSFTFDMPVSGGLKQAVAMEERILAFYEEAAEQSRSLMCDVPRAFGLAAKKRAQRIGRLKALAGQ
ncbi:MAG: hypothetical protein AB1597_03440 [Chloroflexota bacterium]